MRFTMRVSLPHFGHAVDLVVSMTFFRSAVFAIFAIQYSPDRNVPSARTAVVLPGDWEVSRIAGPTRIRPAESKHAQKRCTVLASRILHEVKRRCRNGDFNFSSRCTYGHKRPALVQRRRLPRATTLFEFCGDVEYDVFLPGPADDLYSDRQAFCRRAYWNHDGGET